MDETLPAVSYSSAGLFPSTYTHRAASRTDFPDEIATWYAPLLSVPISTIRSLANQSSGCPSVSQSVTFSRLSMSSSRSAKPSVTAAVYLQNSYGWPTYSVPWKRRLKMRCKQYTTGRRWILEYGIKLHWMDLFNKYEYATVYWGSSKQIRRNIRGESRPHRIARYGIGVRK